MSVFQPGSRFEPLTHQVRPKNPSVKRDIIPFSDILSGIHGTQTEKKKEPTVDIHKKKTTIKRQTGKKKKVVQKKSAKKITVSDRSESIRRQMYNGKSKVLTEPVSKIK